MTNITFEEVKEKKQAIIVAELASEIWNEYYINIISKKQIDYMLTTFQSLESIQSQIESGSEYYIIYDEKTPVGYLSFQKQDDHIFLSKLYIKFTARNKGIGKKALNLVKAKCKNKKIKSIRLTVNKHNYPAIDIYKRRGFKTIDSVETDIGEGFIMDDYILELKI